MVRVVAHIKLTQPAPRVKPHLVEQYRSNGTHQRDRTCPRVRAFGRLEPKHQVARKRSSTPPPEDVYSPSMPITPPQTTRAITLSCRYRTPFWSYPSCRSSTWHRWSRRC